MPNSWHNLTVGTGLLCCVAICLIGVGHMDTGVIQHPNFLVKGSGETVVLSCNLIEGHTYIYWYQQVLNKELKFLISRRNEQILDDSGMPKHRFSTEWSQKLPGILKIQLSEPGDSAVYFCASSL
uniref:Ig-like domain-containing protein n=1 Tax=Sarcophilus harrisii TaxID=9305 RepID=A0A7N4PSQ5_SARHA